MDNWRKITYGIGRSVTLSAGLLGLYLFHKKHIPEFMGFVSSGVACASIYAWTTYFFTKTDKNKVNGCCADKEASTKTLMTAEEFAIKRRKINKFKEVTSKLLEDLGKKDYRPNFGEAMPEMIDFSYLESPDIDFGDVPLFTEFLKEISGELNQNELEE